MNLIFEKYYVPKLMCEEKSAGYSLTDKKIDLKQRISSNIRIKDNTVNLTLNYSTVENDYIDVKVSIVGIFTLKFEDQETLSKDDTDKITAIKSTALAVLFPYLRQTVTSLTQMNADLNPIIIPMYNISKLLENTTE